MSNKIKIAFFDVDGTLTSNHVVADNTMQRIPSSTKKALALLKENGVLPVIATGRSWLYIKQLAEDLSIDSVIASNGASIIYQNKESFRHFLSKEEIIGILKELDEFDDLMVTLETTKGDILYHYNQASIEELAELEVYQMVILGDDLKEKIQLKTTGIQTKMVAPVVMNVFSAQISKGSGIKTMLELLDLDNSNAIAFGDEENDIDMFKSVVTSVAMGDAVDSLKAIASYVTDTVDEDGIYNACQHFGLI